MSDLPHELRLAKEEELEFLISKAEAYLPHSQTIFGLLSVGFRRQMVDRSYTKIYVPIRPDFPFFIIITGVVRKPTRNNMTPFWNPEEVNNEEAKLLLKSLPNWDPKSPLMLNCSYLETLEQIEQIMTGEGGLAPDLHVFKEGDGYTYKIPLGTKIQRPRISDTNFFLCPLNENFASELHRNWDYLQNDTIEGIQGYMRTLPTMAAFDKREPSDTNYQGSSTDINGIHIEGSFKPVSWAITRHFGELGFTATLPEYRRKGLAKAVTCALIEKLLEIGISTHINVGDNAEASVKMHEKLGFERYTTMGYHFYFNKGMKIKDF